MNYETILHDFKLEDKHILSVFTYGSRAYGTYDYQSDHDFIIVMTNENHDKDALDSSYNKINVTIYSEDSFIDKIKQHKISALECLFLPKELILKNTKSFSFKLDKDILRSSIGEKTSHSWVKAKKKFEVEQDRNVYIAKKSLFHSLRIADFGVQIAQNGKIINYNSCNSLWEEIKANEADDWLTYKNKYQELLNNKMTEFRKFTPKGSKNEK
jgi:predicted nucleotidyltransferase